jgi:hypothetical protein
MTFVLCVLWVVCGYGVFGMDSAYRRVKGKSCGGKRMAVKLALSLVLGPIIPTLLGCLLAVLWVVRRGVN